MTHDHQLDLQLAAAILTRNDVAWFGLIGSKSKCARFAHRLGERGVPAEVIQRMRCPMGLAKVKGKLPMEIAVSIAGASPRQRVLIVVRQANEFAPTATASLRKGFMRTP